MTNRGKTVIGVIVCVAVLICGAVAYFLYAVHDADRYLPRIMAYARQKTGLEISIRHCAVGLFPLTIRLYDVDIKNPKPFPPGYFLKAPAVEATVGVGPLLHHKIAFRSIRLDRPVINFISDPDGGWNFQDPAQSKQQAQKPPRFSMSGIAKLQIKHGVLLGSALIEPFDRPGPTVLEVQDFSGELKQIHFDAFKDTSSPIVGNLRGDKAQFGDIHLTDLSSDLRILPEQLTFKNFHAKTYRGHANGNLTFNFSGKNTKFNTDLEVTGIGVKYLLAEFETSPPDMTGMMKANFKLAGEIEHTANPLAGTVGGGQFTVGKGEVPSFDQVKSMAEIKRFRSPGAAALPASAFSSFAGDIELKNHRIYSKEIGVDFYGIDVKGSGNVDEISGALNYRGSAVIVKKQGFFTSTFAKLFKGAKEKEGKLTFPIRLTGTLQNPDLSVVKGSDSSHDQAKNPPNHLTSVR